MAISLAASRVLIVDDNEFNRKSLALIIRRAGLTQIEFAENGVEGLRKVASFRPDLVLLDVNMPVMDGLEMCRQLRRSATHEELPVLFQTALDSDEEQVRCFEAGGSDLISKPIKPGECVARVRHQLEKRKLFNDLANFRERVERELKHAQAMQLSLLPEPKRLQAIAERYELVLDAHFETSSELGGDFWNVYPLDDNRVAFLIADFAGHGITAAINAFRLHTLIDRFPMQHVPPSEWLANLNGALKDVLPTGQFATAFFGILDLHTDTLTYASAGAPNPVLGVGGDIRLLDSAGLVLGASRRAKYVDRSLRLPRGGFLFLYSDALIECSGEGNGPIGQDGVPDVLRGALAINRTQPLIPLLDHFYARTKQPLRDDLTTVWIARRP
ncbi:PP2C family protein-serine/threonine phosphatase [Azospirillum rugosum]|uniref:Sigma-B regulation protein RsbU (Phosphoserine phosphatase) n=1 Tax=Azospirillum rugosum TaxID=416170 RepID=A0ABS4SIL5_9PROT|nr:fused response regulator/phosphatase [Azospirillum rugosum]MBP2292408.1 sigma-B regulation protein RsbU (phosphoserine phosphatase) [Azospirillum rugosum]MDQ0526167.1 sigma-B regulation protein RsbU (phosphoserine phosphatase) [Azospirillum rugosum]